MATREVLSDAPKSMGTRHTILDLPRKNHFTHTLGVKVYKVINWVNPILGGPLINLFILEQLCLRSDSNRHARKSTGS